MFFSHFFLLHATMFQSNICLVIQRFYEVIKLVFSSLEFIFVFLPVFFMLYAMAPVKIKNAVIFMGSIVFYAYGSWETPEYILLFFLSILLNFSIGKCMGRGKKRDTFLLVLGILFNVMPLAWFKWRIDDVILPVGISFFTFQNLSYLIDVKRRTVEREESFIRYGAYISMFPQLIAGPIVTYRQMQKQLVERKVTKENISRGISLFVLGLGAKVLIANRIGNLWFNIKSIGFDSISTPLAWMGIVAYSLQIYFDFYGYSLMAMGLAAVMGFSLPQNFDNPYRAVTMSEFYRKWHMTLGQWFREYVYIPLGGNRKGNVRTICNLFVVWLLTGLWHGFCWNFLAWGLGLFVLIVLEKFVYRKFLEKHRWIGHMYVIAIIPLMWFVFAVTDWQDFTMYLSRLFPVKGNYLGVFVMDYIKYLKLYGGYIVVGILLCTPWPAKIWKKCEKNFLGKIILLLIFAAAVYCMYRGLNDPFLYFRF